MFCKLNDASHMFTPLSVYQLRSYILHLDLSKPTKISLPVYLVNKA